jgi:hypothetical protein
MDDAPTKPPTIIALVEQAVKAWVLAVDLRDDARDLTKESAYAVFYTDTRWPNQIQTSGPDEARWGLRIRPSDVWPGTGGSALIVDVTLAHRVDGRPTTTQFQVALNEDLLVVVH